VAAARRGFGDASAAARAPCLAAGRGRCAAAPAHRPRTGPAPGLRRSLTSASRSAARRHVHWRERADELRRRNRVGTARQRSEHGPLWAPLSLDQPVSVILGHRSALRLTGRQRSGEIVSQILPDEKRHVQPFPATPGPGDAACITGHVSVSLVSLRRTAPSRSMPQIPHSVVAFLSCKRVAVAGVSRTGRTPANAIYRRLAETGHQVFAVNPNASAIEGQPCYANLASIPAGVEAVMVVTHPSVAGRVAQEALDQNIRHIWFHRSFGDGSVSAEAVQLCRSRQVEPIVGGCPLMYCPPVDPAHRLFRWWLRLQDRIPG